MRVVLAAGIIDIYRKVGYDERADGQGKKEQVMFGISESGKQLCLMTRNFDK